MRRLGPTDALCRLANKRAPVELSLVSLSRQWPRQLPRPLTTKDDHSVAPLNAARTPEQGGKWVES